jgi:cytochrome c oxidase subunit 1
VLLVGSFFAPGGATAAGWTLYAPLSTQMGPGMDFAIFAVHIMGASSIMGDQHHRHHPEHARAGHDADEDADVRWTWLITAYLLIAVMPVLAGAITMVLTDRHFGTLLQRGRRRRPGDVPAHLLVLRPPRGVHHDPAGVRHRRR